MSAPPESRKGCPGKDSPNEGLGRQVYEYHEGGLPATVHAVISRVGLKYLVRVVPRGSEADHDRVYGRLDEAREYARLLRDSFGAVIDDQTGGAV